MYAAQQYGISSDGFLCLVEQFVVCFQQNGVGCGSSAHHGFQGLKVQCAKIGVDLFCGQIGVHDSRQVTLCFWMKADAIRI